MNTLAVCRSLNAADPGGWKPYVTILILCALAVISVISFLVQMALSYAKVSS